MVDNKKKKEIRKKLKEKIIANSWEVKDSDGDVVMAPPPGDEEKQTPQIEVPQVPSKK